MWFTTKISRPRWTVGVIKHLSPKISGWQVCSTNGKHAHHCVFVFTGIFWWLRSESIAYYSQVSLDNFWALKYFIMKFPEFSKNEFFITGESYGGIYVPTLSARIVDDKEFNFKVIERVSELQWLRVGDLQRRLWLITLWMIQLQLVHFMCHWNNVTNLQLRVSHILYKDILMILLNIPRIQANLQKDI